MTAWLAGAGVDTAKQAVAPSGSGLVTSRPVNKGEQLFAIPESAWISSQTAAQSEIGQHLAGWVPRHCGRAVSTACRGAPNGAPNDALAAALRLFVRRQFRDDEGFLFLHEDAPTLPGRGKASLTPQ